MAHINLLPWRENLRVQRQREFATIAGGGVIITLLLAGYSYFHIEGVIDHQRSRNSYLNSEIKAVEKKIGEIKDLKKTKERLLAKMNVIQQLQGSRPEIVHLFDELAGTIPEGVFLTKATQKGSQITIEGKAQSNARVSAYMRNIEGSSWISSPSLQVIENKDRTGTGFSHFTLTFKQAKKKAKKEGAK